MLVYPTIEPWRIEAHFLKMSELLKNSSVGMPISGKRAYQLMKHMLDKMPAASKQNTR